MNEIDLRTPSKTRAEDVLPPTFHPSPLAAGMLQDQGARRTALEYLAESMGEVRVAASVLATEVEDGEDPTMRPRLAEFVSTETGRAQRLLRALATGALALALVTVALVAGPTSGRAQAAEAPTPDPTGSVATAPVYPVVLDRLVKAVPVPVVSHTPTSAGYCVSVVRLGQPLGRSCSSVPWFTVTAWVDARVTPLGRVVAYVADDATGASVPIVLDVRRPSRFGVGYYEDRGRGDLYAQIPVTLYSPILGRWVPQVQSPVQIQELTRRGWRTRATLVTNPPGLAAGIVHLGGGRHIIRAVRPNGASVWSVTGRNRLVVVTTEPLDVV